MKCLVTGGAGFIGSHLVDLLLDNGHEVVVLDNFSSGSEANLESALESGRTEVIRADITDADLEKIFKNLNPEVVFHLAAQIDVRKSVQDPLWDAQMNILSTIRLAQAAVAAGVHKVVFTSSGGAIYGKTAELPISEKVLPDPKSPYAASKYAAEIYLNVFSELYGLQVTHIAPSNVYGPRQNPHGEAGVVAIFSQALLDGNPTRVFGDGSNTRDYVYVKDVAQAFFLAAGKLGNGERFNIGTSKQTSDRELHDLVACVVGTDQTPLLEPPRLGDLKNSALSYEKARESLGWVPKYNLRDGLIETVTYFKQKG